MSKLAQSLKDLTDKVESKEITAADFAAEVAKLELPEVMVNTMKTKPSDDAVFEYFKDWVNNSENWETVLDGEADNLMNESFTPKTLRKYFELNKKLSDKDKKVLNERLQRLSKPILEAASKAKDFEDRHRAISEHGNYKETVHLSRLVTGGLEPSWYVG